MSLEYTISYLPILYEHEDRQKKVKNYFRFHQFSAGERSDVIEWMLRSVDIYQLKPEIFFLGVSYFDLMFSKRVLPSDHFMKLVCIGACCICLALHILGDPNLNIPDEILTVVSAIHPTLGTLELHKMYSLIIERFNCKVFLVTPFNFLTSYHIILRLKHHHDLTAMSNYILELSQYDETICVTNRYKPSLIAAAALYTGLIALKLTKKWILDLSILTPYNGDEEELITVHNRMMEIVKIAHLGKYHSAHKKYCQSENNCVGLLDFSNS